jgi:hypothetical protein
MDEFFEWKTAHAVEDPLDEETSLNGESAAQSATVPA